jgi:hypothetical protein
MVIIMTATNIKHRSKQQHSHGQPIVDQMYDKTPMKKMKEQKEISPILFWQELAISSSSSVLIC